MPPHPAVLYAPSDRLQVICLTGHITFVFLKAGAYMKKIIELKNVSKSFDGELVLDILDHF